jgi:hypothetical protein
MMAGLTPDEILEQFKTKGERFWVSQAGPMEDPVFTERDHRQLKKKIREQTANFVDQMTLGTDLEMLAMGINRGDAHECFSDIAWIVSAITQESYCWPPRGDNVFSMSNLENAGAAKTKWLEWVELHQCDLTPCYDLQAAYEALPFMLHPYLPAVNRKIGEADIPGMVEWLEGSVVEG